MKQKLPSQSSCSTLDACHCPAVIVLFPGDRLCDVISLSSRAGLHLLLLLLCYEGTHPRGLCYQIGNIHYQLIVVVKAVSNALGVKQRET